jgi:hypothetical protein
MTEACGPTTQLNVDSIRPAGLSSNPGVPPREAELPIGLSRTKKRKKKKKKKPHIETAIGLGNPPN